MAKRSKYPRIVDGFFGRQVVEKPPAPAVRRKLEAEAIAARYDLELVRPTPKPKRVGGKVRKPKPDPMAQVVTALERLSAKATRTETEEKYFQELCRAFRDQNLRAANEKAAKAAAKAAAAAKAKAAAAAAARRSRWRRP
jgi:hypothetical protein